MVRSILTDDNDVFATCAWVTGQYGIDGVYLGVPARLGAAGVEEIVELPLEQIELDGLRAAAAAIRDKVGELDQVSYD